MFSKTSLAGLLFSPGTFLLSFDGLAGALQGPTQPARTFLTSHPQHGTWQDTGGCSWLFLMLQHLAREQQIGEQAGRPSVELGGLGLQGQAQYLPSKEL